MHHVLAHGAPWSSRDVRALSQSSRALNQWISGAQPHVYGKAHQMTLTRALGSNHFPLGNRRAANVLGAMGTLQLMEGNGPAPHLCDPSRTDAKRLAQVLRAIHRAQNVYLGNATVNLAPWEHLLQGGLQVGALTTLNVAAATFTWAELEQFAHTFALMPSLKELVLPNHVTCHTAGDAKLMEACPQPSRRLGFGPLTSLRKLTWKTSTVHGCTAVDLSGNVNLRHLALALGSGYGVGFQGFEVGAYPHRNTLLLPRAPLKILHVQDVVVSPDTAHPLSDAPWQDSLVELRLALQSECPFVAVDLSGHTALRRFALEFYGHELQGLRLPPPQQLEALSLTGDATASLLQQLRVPQKSALRRLSLDCRVEPKGAANSIPWAHLPNLTTLTCASWDNDPDRMQLSRLNIPHPNGLKRLRLEHTVFKASFWAPEAAALQALCMPQLRTLDLSGINSCWKSDEPVGAIVQSFDEALGQRTRWPALEEIVAAGVHPRSTLSQNLERLAARHGLRFTLTSPTPHPEPPFESP